jgi:hypothetical protein
MNEIDLVRKMREQGLDLNSAETIEKKALVFERSLKLVIRPKNQSDRTCFRDLTNWLLVKCNAGRLDSDTIFRRILDFALEASGPGSKNPAAVFMSILKKELGYPTSASRRRDG